MPSLREDRYSKKAGTVRAMFISRIHEVKNLDYAIKVFSKIKEQGEFDIYGPIESKDYWNKCVELIKKVPDNITIKYCGCINPNEVSKIYSQYDCFLFPTQNENYGHVIAEALANQCPVILSRGTTPWDDIDEKAGFVCKLYNDDEFINALSKIAAMNAKEYENLMEKTHLYYVEKKKESEAIVGHKAMFESIIKTMIK